MIQCLLLNLGDGILFFGSLYIMRTHLRLFSILKPRGFLILILDPEVVKI